MDVYRLNESSDSVGVEDYFDKDGICIIEWADLIEDKLPEDRLDIKFKVIDENTRVLKFIPHGEKYESIVNSVI
jgi:tRNA threonylcarbamoyladenosine biosynthesis protein TsaE